MADNGPGMSHGLAEVGQYLNFMPQFPESGEGLRRKATFHF